MFGPSYDAVWLHKVYEVIKHNKYDKTAVTILVYGLAILPTISIASQWYHNDHGGFSSHQHLDCLLNRLFQCRSRKTSKLHFTGLCEGNPPVTSGFPSQKASNVENASIWWCHNGKCLPGSPTSCVGDVGRGNLSMTSGMRWHRNKKLNCGMYQLKVMY